MRIPVALRVLSAATLAVFTACSGELPSGPTAAPLDLAGPSLAMGGSPGKGGSTVASTRRTLTIDVNTAKSAVYRLGGQDWVYIPAGAICSDDAGYGPALWDAPCTPATGIVSIGVTLSGSAQPGAEFHKDVRFAPAADNDWRGWVILGLKVHGNLNSQLGYGILYRPTGSSEWIDEAATDPSLRAWRTAGNVIARRLKHFSGYNVSLGFSEQMDPMGEPGGLQ